MDISQDLLYKLFLQSRNLKQSSIGRYEIYLKMYSDFLTNLHKNVYNRLKRKKKTISACDNGTLKSIY